MASVNKVILVGSVGQDPKIKEYATDKKVASVSLATSFMSRDKNGELVAQTEWHKLQVWGRNAEVVEKYVRTGTSLYVEGRLSTRKYTNKDNVEVSTTEIVVENLQLLGGKPKDESKEETKKKVETPSDPDFPF